MGACSGIGASATLGAQTGIQPLTRCVPEHMETYALDGATALTQISEDRFAREVDQTWWNFDSAFGGWAAATALSAVEAHSEVRGELLTINCLFPAAIKAGRVELNVELMARRTQSDFWRVTMTHEAADGVVFSADLVMGRRRKIDEPGFQVAAPTVPDQDAVPLMDMEGVGPAWLQHYDQRLFQGVPFTVNETPTTRALISHKDKRRIDTKALLAIADTPMPRVFFTSTTPRFGSTIALSVSLICGRERLSDLSPDTALIEANSRCVNNGIYDQDVRIWSSDGSLLAVSNQTAVYR